MSVFLIAEAGINHGGKFSEALKLVDAAKWAGADAVKFQMFSSQRLWGDDRIKQYELSEPQMRDIAAYCKFVGIEFMCTPFGVEEVEFLAPMLKRIKIASGCITRKPLLDAVNHSRLPVVLSTGMSTENEIDAAMLAVAGFGICTYEGGPVIDHAIEYDRITLMHCTSSYPCRLEDVNLRVLMEWEKGYRIKLGYSDHTNGITVALAAVALGAVMIEKHLTLDRNAEGPDHAASITPKEFKAMHMALIEVEACLGDGQKRVMPSEEKLRKAWRD